MLYSVQTIAEAFIRRGIESENPLTHLQVQKLCFLAQGYSLAVTGNPVFAEPVNAWPYGPVIADLYTCLKRYGNQPITNPNALMAPPVTDEDTQELIGVIYRDYGHLQGGQLTALTHQPGTPWANTWDVQKYGIIPNNEIRRYYRQVLRDALPA